MPSMKYLWVNRYSIINGISVRVAAAIIRCVSLSYWPVNCNLSIT